MHETMVACVSGLREFDRTAGKQGPRKGQVELQAMEKPIEAWAILRSGKWVLSLPDGIDDDILETHDIEPCGQGEGGMVRIRLTRRQLEKQMRKGSGQGMGNVQS